MNGRYGDMMPQMLDSWTDGRTDADVILYSVQCYAMHWTDNKKLRYYIQFFAYQLSTVLRMIDACHFVF